ncbi:hypothetical protein SDC9_105665 [bioreactor metagenome]|uniref:Uncharacterized protein n=1 Tax=bioreactor metagenome TaxID=1076179 RepID=A0A645B061_9ZZZZ
MIIYFIELYIDFSETTLVTSDNISFIEKQWGSNVANVVYLC